LFQVEASIKAVWWKRGWEFKTMFATFYWQGNPSKSLHGWHVSILRSNINQIIVGKIFVSDI
jgi:hypothetical protein